MLKDTAFLVGSCISKWFPPPQLCPLLVFGLKLVASAEAGPLGTALPVPPHQGLRRQVGGSQGPGFLNVLLHCPGPAVLVLGSRGRSWLGDRGKTAGEPGSELVAEQSAALATRMVHSQSASGGGPGRVQGCPAFQAGGCTSRAGAAVPMEPPAQPGCSRQGA